MGRCPGKTLFPHNPVKRSKLIKIHWLGLSWCQIDVGIRT
jgi:hypothetical protein